MHRPHWRTATYCNIVDLPRSTNGIVVAYDAVHVPIATPAVSSGTIAEDQEHATTRLLATQENSNQSVSCDSCMHEHCFSCIFQWASIKNTCPQCRLHFQFIFVEEQTFRVPNSHLFLKMEARGGKYIGAYACEREHSS